jgi:hypothetical protein
MMAGVVGWLIGELLVVSGFVVGVVVLRIMI